MFPSVSGVAGYIPDGTPTADPLNDPDLIASAQDHWWVEAYLPGQGWTDLDPAFPGAAAGQSFATPGANDRIVELPDALRHQLELTLRVEQYNEFPVSTTNLSTFRPLSVTLPVPQVAAKEIVLGHVLATENTGGLAFSTVQHTYTPYFVIDNWALYAGGEAYQDLLTNFPLATNFTSGQWLEFKLTDPDGNVAEYERVVKDLLGADVRVGGGTPQIALPGGSGALVSDIDQFATWILPNSVDDWVAERQQTQAVSRMVTVAGLVADILDWGDREDALTPEEELQYSQTIQRAQVLLSTLLAGGGITFAVAADREMAEREAGMLVAQYFAEPRIFAFGSAFNPITEEEVLTVDLRKTDAAAIPYPGQALSAAATANWVKGLAESRLEGEALDGITSAPDPAFTTWRLFEEMAAQGIEPLLLGPDDLGLLGSLDLSPALYFYAAQALQAGQQIVVPSQGVAWQGETRLAFWQVDPATGETIGVGDNGLHTAVVEYTTQLELIVKKISKPIIKRISKAVRELYDNLVAELVPALGGRRSMAPSGWHFLDSQTCPVASCGIEQFFSDAPGQPIDLPGQLFVYVAPVAGDEMDRATVGATAATPFSVGVDPATSTIDVGESASFQAQLTQPDGSDFLAAVYAPAGWTIDVDASGLVTADHPAGIAPGDYQLLLVAQAAGDRTAVGSALHTVTVNAGDDLNVVIAPEANITVNVDGAQLPDAAWTVDLHNRSTNTHTFTVDISGVAAADLILNGVAGQATAEATLQPGELRRIGLYYVPDALPAPGTPIDLSAAVTMDDPPLSDGDSSAGTVPTLPYPRVTLPETIFAPADGVTQFELALDNVGNAGGTFDLSPALPPGWSLANLSSPLTVGQGATSAQRVDLTTVGGVVGQRYPLFVTVESGATRLTAQTEVAIVTPESQRLFVAANSCTLNDSLEASLAALALAVVELEQWCGAGDCPLPLRDQAAAAGQSVVSTAAAAASPIALPALPAVETAVDALAAAAADNDILTAVADLSVAIESLSGNLCTVAQHRVDGRFTPYVEAILLGDSAGFSLDVTNLGTLTTTYAITVTGLPGGDLFFDETLAPGETVNRPVTPLPAATGNFNVVATIVANVAGAVEVGDTAVARLNVVDRFVQVTQVNADPPFVETGVSSTTLSVAVANFAGVGLESVAETAIVAPDGSRPFSATVPLTILAGNPRVYELISVDTSGWAAGIYTATVDLLDENSDPIPDGSGYGFFTVGQALQLDHAVVPQIVAPGIVTVTTIITSTISGGAPAINGGSTLYDAPLTVVDQTYLDPQSAAAPNAADAGSGPPEASGAPLSPSAVAEADSPAPSNTPGLPSPFYSAPPAFTRLEQDDPTWIYSGTWSAVTLQQASGGSHWRNAAAGSAAELTFDGTWVGVGFIADRFGGIAEVTIDGSSAGFVDLYRNEVTPISTLFDGLSAGTHTLVIEVQGSANPFASSTRVQLDYADYGDGSALPDGSFEEDEARLIKSSGWVPTTYAGASGGSFASSNSGTAWFPFTGDSFSLDTIAYSSAGKARLFVDGVFLDTIDMFAPVFATAGISRTFSYEGFGAGPHVLQVMTYQDRTSIDRLTTPGSAPFIDPDPPVSGVTRFEADHPAIQYNGVPFTQTATSWVRIANIVSNRASAGEYIYSAAVSDTISFDFEGEWLGVGFAVDRFGGQAEIAIDGQPVQSVDLYGRYEDTASFYFGELGAGLHTVTITVLGSSNPNASGSRVYLDFFDVWDGQPLADGTFEEDDDRLIYGNGWTRTLNPAASGGAYGATGTSTDSTVWFPFSGDSITYQSWSTLNLDLVDIRINGESRGTFSLYQYESGPRTYSFDNLGPGPHVMEIRHYRDTATVDALITPAIEPAYEAPIPGPIVRYEEDHPALRYNGEPFPITDQTWVLEGGGNPWRSSGSNNMTTSTSGNVWSLDFDGQWLNIGFRSTATSGQVEIFIDGLSQGTFDTANGVNNVKNVTFGDLAPGSHTVEVVVDSGTVLPDYMDVWDGTALDAGWYDADLEDTTGRFHFSNRDWWRRGENIYAYDGDFLNGFSSTQNNIWFTFSGNDLTVLGHNRDSTELEIVIDGVSQGVFDMAATPPFSDQPAALHFPDLGEGAHVVQIHMPTNAARIDAFEVNPDTFTSYVPEIQWYDTAPAAVGSNPDFYNSGMLSSIAIGDLNGDGLVELVAPSTNGTLYVYRGDGQDAGGGSPLIWSTDVVGVAAEPALADLDNDGLAEIVVSGFNGTFAFAYDGTQLWHNPDVKAYTTDSGGTAGWGGPTIGNLDLDPEPEIAIAASEDAVYVLDHEGNTLWSDPIGRWPTPPLLADISGDGVLDIVVGREWELEVIDFFNGGQIVWTYVQTDTIGFLGGQGLFGAPAIADLNGDGRPEIVVNWGHLVEAIQDDGTLLWRYETNRTDLYRPSPVTIADVTGDGRMNVVTASAINAGLIVFDHLLQVLDADGNLVWEQEVADNSASASGVAAQDLTGDGVWEILWNGASDGFLVIRGSDGKRLFNEPYTASGTAMDYPTLGDVTGDGTADVVLGGYEGIFVLSHIDRWTDSRPLWNQHNYHVTNINDDWSVPINEPNSWDLHNTYRTQTPDRSPAPAYQMVFTYTAGAPDVTVLTDTASISLTVDAPLYGWEYRQEWYQPLITTTFDSLLTGLQPGETRQVSAGTEVAYWLPGGFNYLTLPPLYVTAQGLGELLPAAQSVVVGGTVVYTLTLTNPGAAGATYTVAAGGVPADWLTYPATVPLGAGETAPVTVTVTVPPDADPDTLALWLDVDNGSGGTDDFVAALTLFDGLDLTLTPASQMGPTGRPLTYTLTISNLETVERTYALSASGLADVTLPAAVTVAGGGTEVVVVTAVPPAQGPQPFAIAAAAGGAAGAVDGIAVGDGRFGLLAQFDPATASTGPGATAVYTLTLSNLGDVGESALLSLDAPAGWTVELTQLSRPISQVDLPALLFNSTELLLLVTPDEGAIAGSYPISVTAESVRHEGVVAVAVATAEIAARGVSVTIDPGDQTVDPTTPSSWDVTVTNTGSVADTFDLAVGGVPALAGELSSATVTLDPGAVETVQLTAADLRFLLPGAQAFVVAAQSQTDAAIQAQDRATFTVLDLEAAAVAWRPESRTVTNTLTTALTFVITNTGNLLTTYELDFAGAGITATFAVDAIPIPPRSAAAFLVTVTAGAPGSYQLAGTATTAGGVVTATATAAVDFLVSVNQLPEVTAAADDSIQIGAELSAVLATFSDGDPLDVHTAEIDWGDGTVTAGVVDQVAGTVSGAHTYGASGQYSVTVTVTDNQGGVGSDALTVTVEPYLLFVPVVPWRD